MRGYTDSAILRLGAITIVVLLLVMAAAFNLSKFPGFGGNIYHAAFSDASGLREGNVVQVAGIRVGRVSDIHIEDNTVLVDFEVDHGVEFGSQTKASIEVLNLLGEKFLQLTPAGTGQQSTDETIPLARTESAYDIVGVLGDLTQTTERIDTKQLGTALDTLSTTLNKSSGEIQASFTGLSRLSRTIYTRDAELQELLEHADSVTRLLAARKGDLVTLMKDGDLLLKELRRRREAIHTLLVSTSELSEQLSGLVRDNQAQIGPALRNVRAVLGVLQRNEKQLDAAISAMGPYANILGNIIGTGPWFDAYVVNLAGIGTGEFVPGVRAKGGE